MDKKLQEQLKEKYPEILQRLGGDPYETCMSSGHGGISVGDGWYDLLDELFRFLQFNTDKNYYPQIIAEQIKEKFGTLSFYYDSKPTPLDFTPKDGVVIDRPIAFQNGAIRFATGHSGKVCEECGKPGRLRQTAWISTRCDECV